MQLTDVDRRMLDGSEGRLVAEAMKFLVRFGEVYGAKRMIPIDYAYVYIDCIDSWGSGDLSENLLQEALAAGVKCKVPTTTWVSGREIDAARYADLEITKGVLDELDKESRIGKAFGMTHIDTCAPYLISDLSVPAFGAHIASIESSAVVYYNTAMGVRTNRDGITAFFASLTGRYPEFGMHLTENRRGQHLVKVLTEMRNTADYSALGFLLGKKCGLDIPVIEGLPRLSTLEMQCLCAALAVGGAVSLAHIVGVTPEAPTREAAFGGRSPEQTWEIRRSDLDQVYERFTSSSDKVDFISLGCPHASIHDLMKYAERFRGRRVAPGVRVWLTSSPQALHTAAAGGELKILQEAGVTILTTCPIVNPGAPGPLHTFHNPEFSIGNFATNSMKLLYYSRNCLRPGKTFFGSTDQCIEAAILGRWVGDPEPSSGGG